MPNEVAQPCEYRGEVPANSGNDSVRLPSTLHDIPHGDSGKDRLVGGARDVSLNAGTGQDRLTGNGAADGSLTLYTARFGVGDLTL